MNSTLDEQFYGIYASGRILVKICSVTSVDSFDEFQISLTLKDGECLVIDGMSMSVKDVNLDSGIVEAEGEISGLNYYDKNPVKRSGFLKGLFGFK